LGFTRARERFFTSNAAKSLVQAKSWILDFLLFLRLIILTNMIIIQKMELRDIMDYDYVKKALAFGFDHSAALDPATLIALPEVRDMCAADKCRSYGKRWTCPPACGSVEENQRKINSYNSGLLVQTTGALIDEFDYEEMTLTGERHKDRFNAFRNTLGRDSLALGAGACTLCETCSYPTPCRYPDQAVSSMEAYGLLVNRVCEANGLEYYYGNRTITYTGCYLFL
jgi:predicted metal-binding protein